jgi:hypothetical protein
MGAEKHSGCAADAAARACDDCHLAFKQSHRYLLIFDLRLGTFNLRLATFDLRFATS